MDITRRPNESTLDYHKRIIYGKLVDKELSDIDYAELSELAYGQSYSSDVARRMFYGSRRTLEIMDAQSIGQISDRDFINNIDAKRQELIKERIKLQIEKAEYNRWLRDSAREELFEQKVIEAIHKNITPCTIPDSIPVVKGYRCGVLCITDTHFGKEYKLYGLNDEIVNQYSPEIFYDRMEQIYNETVTKLDEGRIPSCSALRVYNLGDSVDGFLRHNQAWSLRYGVMDAAIIFGNYMGDWLRKLSKRVNIVYAQTDGNHDELRLLDGKKGQHSQDSVGKIILNCIKLKNEDNPNICIINNKTGFIYDNICGYDILGVHGECTDVERAIKEYSNIYNKDISYLFCGHKHKTSFSNCGIRKGCIGVGSVIGSDDFSMSLRKCADATASLIIFEENKGKVEEYTYVLN